MPPPPKPENVRRVGADAVGRLRRTGAEQFAAILQRDPETMSRAVELGLVRREWLEHPGQGPLSAATPVEVLERFLEREVERRPSTIAALGLSTIQILSANVAARAVDDASEGLADTMTVVFTDLEGFTSYTEHAGDETAGQLLNEHQPVGGPV